MKKLIEDQTTLKRLKALLLFSIFFVLTAATAVLVNGNYFPGAVGIKRNYVKNPDCAKNALHIDANSGSVVRASDSTTLSGSVCEVDASHDAHWAQWEIDTLGLETVGQECAMSFYYSGDGNLYEAVLMSSADVVLTNAVDMENVGSNARFVSINYPCTAGVKPTIDPTSSSAASFKVFGMTYGLATNITNGSIYIPWTNYIPTITPTSGTFATYTLNYAQWMRDGENLYVRGRITFTNANTWSGDAKVSFPTGATTANSLSLVGTATLVDNGTATLPGYLYTGSTFVRIGYHTGSPTSLGTLTSTSPFTWTTNDSIAWESLPIKITEWIGSGQNVMSLNTLPNTTNWAAWTPTGSWTTNTTYYGLWRKNGEMAEYQVRILLAGAPTATGLTVNQLHTTDTTKLINTYVYSALPASSGTSHDWSAGSNYNLQTTYNTSTSVIALYQNNATGTQGIVSQAAPYTFASLDTVTLNWSVPVVGWSSSVVDMPSVRNSTVSDDPGVLKMCSGFITHSGTPVITRSTGNCAASAVDNGAGDTTINFASNTFSGTPWSCGCNSSSAGAVDCQVDNTTPMSSSVVRFQSFTTSTGAALDIDFSFTCFGPR